MKFPYVALWTSVFSFSIYPHSLFHAPGFVQDLTLALHLFNATLPNVTLGEFSCLSNYGTDLTLTSCKKAWDKILQDTELYTYRLQADIAASAHSTWAYLSDTSATTVSAPSTYAQKIIPRTTCSQRLSKEHRGVRSRESVP